MTTSPPLIDASVVRQLVVTQFPQWAELSIQPVATSGWDNRTFHLGSQMLVRLPSAEHYASQVEREQHWLPKLAPHLPVRVPEPLALGEPALGYPWRWSIYRWIEGKTMDQLPRDGLPLLARQLASFLSALHAIDATDGPKSGCENFYRGGSLHVYDDEVRRAADVLHDRMNVSAAMRVWDCALQSSWGEEPIWVHGDIAAGNLLVHEGKLAGVIDFGQMSVGDPACDLALAWTLFDEQSRRAFREALSLDTATWARGRGWALWKAMILAADMCEANADVRARCWPTISEVLSDHSLAES